MSGRAQVSGMTICVCHLNGARIRTEGTVRDLDVRDLGVSDAGGMLIGVRLSSGD